MNDDDRPIAGMEGADAEEPSETTSDDMDIATDGMPIAEWGDTNADEPLDPALNNVDNESLETQEKERYKQDTKQRKFLAQWVVWTDSMWLGSVIVILVLVGLDVLDLSNSVINTLLATSTANVLGLAYIVLEGLFGKSNNRRRLK